MSEATSQKVLQDTSNIHMQRAPNFYCSTFGAPNPEERGKLFYLQLELFCLQLSFFAYSPPKALIRSTFPL